MPGGVDRLNLEQLAELQQIAQSSLPRGSNSMIGNINKFLEEQTSSQAQQLPQAQPRQSGQQSVKETAPAQETSGQAGPPVPQI